LEEENKDEKQKTEKLKTEFKTLLRTFLNEDKVLEQDSRYEFCRPISAGVGCVGRGHRSDTCVIQ